MTKYKFTKEEIQEAVASSLSVSEVMQKLGIRLTGGSHSHLSDRIKREGIDTSHFLGQARRRGQPSNNRREASTVLTRWPEDSFRPKAVLLRRVMLEAGIEHICSQCGLSDWQGAPITLDVDHINGDWLDNRQENLRFMCPNCHSQTPTFGYKKRS